MGLFCQVALDELHDLQSQEFSEDGVGGCERAILILFGCHSCGYRKISWVSVDTGS